MTKDFSDKHFISFDEGVENINQVIQSERLDGFSKRGAPIVTSKHASAAKLIEKLTVRGLPEGFNKWQLPVYFKGIGAQFFITVAAPNSKVGEHAHEEGHALRFIVAGAIKYQDHLLQAGDWMFVPQDTPYSFETTELGATMFYCYQCCCQINVA